MTEKISWEEIRERLAELRADIDKTREKIDENQRHWREYLESSGHKEFLRLHEELCGSQSSTPKVKNK